MAMTFVKKRDVRDEAVLMADNARLQAEVKELRNDYLRICRGHDQLHDERDECREDRDRLQAEVERLLALLRQVKRQADSPMFSQVTLGRIRKIVNDELQSKQPCGVSGTQSEG